MNSNNLLEFLQTGFRVSLGATTSLIEILQDPQQRQENLSQLMSDLGNRVAEWAEKGEKTEKEARNFLEEMLKQRSTSASPGTATVSYTPPTSPTYPAAGNTQQEIEELTEQLAAIRNELEQMRNSSSN